MIVLDASAAVLGLLHDGEARAALDHETLFAPHTADAEVAHALRGRVLRGLLAADTAATALQRWATLGMTRFPVTGLLDRVWELRDNLTAYDAAYVALAEVLDAPLHTADARLAAAPGPRCRVVVFRD